MGSEMCIRDRFHTWQPRKELHRNPHAVWIHKGRRGSSVPAAQIKTPPGLMARGFYLCSHLCHDLTKLQSVFHAIYLSDEWLVSANLVMTNRLIISEMEQHAVPGMSA